MKYRSYSSNFFFFTSFVFINASGTSLFKNNLKTSENLLSNNNLNRLNNDLLFASPPVTKLWRVIASSMGDDKKGQQYLNGDFYNNTISPIYLGNNKNLFKKILDIIDEIFFYITFGIWNFIKEKTFFLIYKIFPQLFINPQILKEYAFSQRKKILRLLSSYDKLYSPNIEDAYENMYVDYFREAIFDLLIFGNNSAIKHEFAINFQIIKDFLESNLNALPVEYRNLFWLDLLIKKTNLNFYILGNRLSIFPTLVSTFIPQVRDMITGPFFLHMITRNVNEKSIIFLKDNIDYIVNYKFPNKEEEILFMSNISKSYLSGIDNILSLLGVVYKFIKTPIIFVFSTLLQFLSLFKRIFTYLTNEENIPINNIDRFKTSDITLENIYEVRKFRNTLINLSLDNDMLQSKGVFFSNYPIYYLVDKIEYKIQAFFYKLSSDILFRAIDYFGRNEESYFPEEIIVNDVNNKIICNYLKSFKHSIDEEVTLPHVIVEGGMNISLTFIRMCESIINENTNKIINRTDIQDPLRVTNILLNQKHLGKTSMSVGSVAKKSFSNIFQYNMSNLKSLLSVYFIHEDDGRLNVFNQYFQAIIIRLHSAFSGGGIWNPWKNNINMIVIENVNRFLGSRKKNDMDNIKTSGVNHLLGIITHQKKHFLFLQCYNSEEVDSAIKSRMDFSITLTIREHEEYQNLIRRTLLEIIRDNPNLLNFADEKFEIYLFELTQAFRKKYISLRMVKELMYYYICVQGKEKGTTLKVIIDLINNDRMA